ncbi:CLIP domain-containing serine protease B4-like [Cydia pomonella]|uniref:CLIP domain-containing serine protease B4-like n=1 Tax=Cydia pomonella TaxID=82600 RepID=UPI002ADE7140|nr:CLIP domain-containing serine protease B4-like [Cydia pomonella]
MCDTVTSLFLLNVFSFTSAYTEERLVFKVDCAGIDVDGHPNLRLLPDNCGVGGEDIGQRLAGAFPVPGLYEYPWMVLISYKTRNPEQGRSFNCGGSLINERYVITTANCLSASVRRRLLGVRVGDYDVDMTTDCVGDPPRCESHVQDIRIEEVHTHPDHQAFKNDIGLIRLKTPVNLFLKNAGTVCLPVTRYLRTRDIDNLDATVTHWRYSEDGYAISKMLYADVTINNAQHCKEQYYKNATKINYTEDNMLNKICASYPDGSDTCPVAGSPLMVQSLFGDRDRFVQYGVQSHGPIGCGILSRPEIYTDVTKYMTWILDTIRP